MNNIKKYFSKCIFSNDIFSIIYKYSSFEQDYKLKLLNKIHDLKLHGYFPMKNFTLKDSMCEIEYEYERLLYKKRKIDTLELYNNCIIS